MTGLNHLSEETLCASTLCASPPVDLLVGGSFHPTTDPAHRSQVSTGLAITEYNNNSQIQGISNISSSDNAITESSDYTDNSTTDSDFCKTPFLMTQQFEFVNLLSSFFSK